MSQKMCELCRLRAATVPDRNKPGRLMNRICGGCHAARLSGDLRRILQAREHAAVKPEAPEPDKQY